MPPDGPWLGKVAWTMMTCPKIANALLRAIAVADGAQFAEASVRLRKPKGGVWQLVDARLPSIDPTSPFLVSLVVSYAGNPIAHQCALMRRSGDGNAFGYDPYGTFAKDGADYWLCIQSALSWPVALLKFPTTTQTSLLRQNNARHAEFTADFQQALANAPTLRHRIERRQSPGVGEADLNVAIVAAVEQAVHGPAHESAPFLDLMARYSSKLCVCITILETAAYFERRPVDLLPSNTHILTELLDWVDARQKKIGFLLREPVSVICRIAA